MTKEEAIEILTRYKEESEEDYYVKRAKALDMAIKALEQEHSDKQRYVVRGINNDKIEFIDKYSVRAFNRYIKVIKDFCKYEVLDKIRAEIEQLRNFRAENYDLEQYCDCFDARIIFRDDVFKILDEYKAESEE